MGTYVDRGIIKWSPFDGLAGFNDLYKELKYRLGKQPMPLLSDDQLNELDWAIQQAVGENRAVYLTYYQDGYFKQTYGHITHIDEIYRAILIDGIRYRLDYIVEIALED
jgi:hypothetical protein